MLRRTALAMIAIVLILSLTGCTGRSIIITWSPNPVVVNVGDTSIAGEVTLKATGMIGSLRIDKAAIVAFDQEGNAVDSWEFEINQTIPPFVSGSHTEPVTLNISYDDVVERNVRKIVVSVTGSDPGTLEIEVQTGN